MWDVNATLCTHVRSKLQKRTLQNSSQLLNWIRPYDVNVLINDVMSQKPCSTCDSIPPCNCLWYSSGWPVCFRRTLKLLLQQIPILSFVWKCILFSPFLQPYPYVIIDLGDVYDVTSIVLWGRPMSYELYGEFA